MDVCSVSDWWGINNWQTRILFRGETSPRFSHFEFPWGTRRQSCLKWYNRTLTEVLVLQVQGHRRQTRTRKQKGLNELRRIIWLHRQPESPIILGSLLNSFIVPDPEGLETRQAPIKPRNLPDLYNCQVDIKYATNERTPVAVSGSSRRGAWGAGCGRPCGPSRSGRNSWAISPSEEAIAGVDPSRR